MSDKKEFQLEILEDGAVKVTFGDMSGVHHTKADKFMEIFAKLMGGTTEVKQIEGAHKHEHGHHHHGEGEAHVHH